MGRRFLQHSFSLLHVDHVHLGPKWNYANVISPYYRLYYIDAGYGTISGPGGKVALEAGHLYLVPSFTLCSLSCQEHLSQYFVQFFEESVDGVSLFANSRRPMKMPATDRDIDHIRRILQINPGRGINRSDNPKVYEKDAYYKEYQELNNLQSPQAYFETQGILLQLLSVFLAHEYFRPVENLQLPAGISDALAFIQLNLAKRITLSELAGRANLHPDYFSRLFMRHTGLRPMAYIQSRRIERAQYLIATTNMPVSGIAADTGFEHLPYFSKVFKMVTGTTPGAYKRRTKDV